MSEAASGGKHSAPIVADLIRQKQKHSQSSLANECFCPSHTLSKKKTWVVTDSAEGVSAETENASCKDSILPLSEKVFWLFKRVELTNTIHFSTRSNMKVRAHS